MVLSIAHAWAFSPPAFGPVDLCRCSRPSSPLVSASSMRQAVRCGRSKVLFLIRFVSFRFLLSNGVTNQAGVSCAGACRHAGGSPSAPAPRFSNFQRQPPCAPSAISTVAVRFVCWLAWQWFVAAAAPELITELCNEPYNPLWSKVTTCVRLLAVVEAMGRRRGESYLFSFGALLDRDPCSLEAPPFRFLLCAWCLVLVWPVLLCTVAFFSR